MLVLVLYLDLTISISFLVCTKRKLTNENSATLWHKQLGHIYENIIKRLVSNEILDSLGFNKLHNLC